MMILVLNANAVVEETISSVNLINIMESVDLIIQMIANVFVIVGGIFAVYQYTKQKKLTKVGNAIDLAKYFATDIIDRACFVYAEFCNDEEIMGIIKSHEEQIKNAKDFNVKEYEHIFTDEERDKYEAFLKKSIEISNGRKITLGGILQDAINELEHCSISFNAGLAEEKSVYQSMHQVIFNLFPCAYPWIGSINKNNVDLFYTNLCELFVRWNKIREKSLKKEEKVLRKEEKVRKKLERYERSRNKSGLVKGPKI